MEALYDILSGASHTTVQMAVNGLCLGLLLTGLTWLVWRKIKNANAATGYVVWWSILSLVIVLPLLLGVLPSGASLAETTEAAPDRTETVAGASSESTEIATDIEPAAAIGERQSNTASRTASIGRSVTVSSASAPHRQCRGPMWSYHPDSCHRVWANRNSQSRPLPRF